jgi:hypothetical protein
MRARTNRIFANGRGCLGAAICFISVAAFAQAASAQYCEGCGCKGGPGYRAANGRCVGWADIGRTCGSPPTQRCTPELVDQGAQKAAEIGAKTMNARRGAPVFAAVIRRGKLTPRIASSANVTLVAQSVLTDRRGPIC